jgi:hypothetical protein
MDQTQLALAGAAGITTTLFRAPYSSEADAIDNYSWPVYKELGEEGYTSVFVDTDSDDWKRPGVSKIIKWATPSKNKGASVLFHDAGGERSQTVKALGTYIKKMKAKGYTFTTISGAIQETESANGQAGAGAGTGAEAGAAPDASQQATGQPGETGQNGQQPGAEQGEQGEQRPVRHPAASRANKAGRRATRAGRRAGPGESTASRPPTAPPPAPPSTKARPSSRPSPSPSGPYRGSRSGSPSSASPSWAASG